MKAGGKYMIYLISGASRSGKTIIGKTMFKRYNIPYISLDYLMMGFMHGVPEMKIHDKLWPHEIAEKMWPFLKAYIETILYNGEDYIIEGEAMLPKYIAELIKEHPNKIRASFVGYTDTEIISKIRDVKLYAKDNDWLVPLGDIEIENHIRNMVGYSEKIKGQSEKYNINYVDTSTSFMKKIEDCIKSLVEN